MWKWLVLTSLAVARWLEQPTPEVRVSGGLVRGTVSPDGLYRQYLAIPYATVNSSNRFQAPYPEPKWEGVFEAINENSICKQRAGDASGPVLGVEDCLSLNVYTPMHHDSQLLPVMVFIHGGGFFSGCGHPAVLGPDYLVKKNIVLVAINYRLNIEGFLCLGIREAPGNTGMKDQVAALKWVQRNIKAFGGDPDNVTIFGESAGAASVSYHLLSPMSKGLFHKAITQSGSALGPWAMQLDPIHTASRLAQQFGFESNDPHELYKFFANKTLDDLITAKVPREKGNVKMVEIIFAPCVEKVIHGEEQFLTDLPINLFSNGTFQKVPMMMGYNNEEGILFVFLEQQNELEEINFEIALPKDLNIEDNNRKKQVGSEMEYKFMKGEEISYESRVALSKYYGEVFIESPVMTEAESHLKFNKNPVYNFKFSYDGLNNAAKTATGFFNVKGATHADELFYLFKPKVMPTPMRFFESKMIDVMTTLWTNFAKFSNPTPQETNLIPTKWMPTNIDTPENLIIDTEFTTEPFWNTESLKYVRDIYQKYRRRNT